MAENDFPDNHAALAIAQLLAREIDTWRPDQARIASTILRAALDGDKTALDALLDSKTGAYHDLTVEQFNQVTYALSKIFNKWPH